MNITDEELLMLEHLTYLNQSVASAAGIDKFGKVNNDYIDFSVYDILQKFDSTAIASLEAMGDTEISSGAYASK